MHDHNTCKIYVIINSEKIKSPLSLCIIYSDRNIWKVPKITVFVSSQFSYLVFSADFHEEFEAKWKTHQTTEFLSNFDSLFQLDFTNTAVITISKWEKMVIKPRKNISMFAVTQPSLLKSTNRQKIINTFFKTFYVSLDMLTSCIFLLKSERFPSSMTFFVV